MANSTIHTDISKDMLEKFGLDEHPVPPEHISHHSGVGVKCRECGKDDEAYLLEEVREEMLRLRLCHYCLIWYERLEKQLQNPDKYIIVKGTAYAICEEPPIKERGWGCGFGGREFRIRFPDGRLVISHNVWCGGDVPAHFRERLPDTAKFEPLPERKLP